MAKVWDKDRSLNQWRTKAFDLATSDDDEKSAWAKHNVWEWEDNDICDRDLWEIFKDTFKDWGVDDFDAIKNTSTNLRYTLRERGVFVNRNPKIANMATSLYNLLSEDEPLDWADADVIPSNKDKPFISHRMIHRVRVQKGEINEDGSDRAAGSGGIGVGAGGPAFQAPAHQVAPYDQTARDIMNLSKLITDDNKYGGLDDNFQYKLTIFNSACQTLGITDDVTKRKAYTLMLKGDALKQHFQSLDPNRPPLDFDNLCWTTRSFYETPSYHRTKLAEFNALSLSGVINDPKNAGKTVLQCFQILYTELQRLFGCLDRTQRIDTILHTRIFAAVSIHPACALAIFNPPESLRSYQACYPPISG